MDDHERTSKLTTAYTDLEAAKYSLFDAGVRVSILERQTTKEQRQIAAIRAHVVRCYTVTDGVGCGEDGLYCLSAPRRPWDGKGAHPYLLIHESMPNPEALCADCGQTDAMGNHQLRPA